MTIFKLTTAQLVGGIEKLTTPTEKYDFSAHSIEETEQLAKDLIESLYHYKGLGISANQLGLNYSVFAMRGDPADYCCFNPVIARPGEELIKLEEGCLSIPGLFMKIERPRHIRVRFADYKGQIDSFTYTGMTARIFQHEIDHLNGKLFFEGCNRITLERAIRQAKGKGFDYTSAGFMKYTRKK